MNKLNRTIMSDFIIFELVCFLHKKYGIIPNGKLQTVKIRFYNKEDLLDVFKDLNIIGKLLRFVVLK